MKFGRSMIVQGPEKLVEHARAAERAGFDVVTLADSQCLTRELYASLGYVAKETDEVRLGPGVTNPVTRHPSVIASGMCTIDEMTEGRTFWGVGSGDSAVYTIGEQATKLDDLKRIITLIKKLCRGERGTYEGETQRLYWVEQADRTFDIPVALAAEGPKTLHVAGQVADEVIVGLGLEPDIVEETVERVNEGARQAGRDPADIEKWFLAYSNVTDDRETAVEQIKHKLAGAAHHSLQFTLEGKRVPDEYEAPIRELVDGYVSEWGTDDGRAHNADLVERLGLTEYLARRYAIAGTPEECLSRIDELEETGLVDGLYFIDYKEQSETARSRLHDVIAERVRN